LESQDDEDEQNENVKEEIKKEKLAKTKVSKKINSKEKIKKDDKVDIVEQESVEVKNQVEGNQRNDLDIIAQKKEELLIDEDLKKPRPKMMTFTPKA
jgi:hypothetical protein